MTGFADRELVEALADRPDHLALADAVAATQRPRRRGRRLAVVLPAAIAAVVALALVSPWDRGGPGTLERALAAVGGGPVIHAIVESSVPADVLVEIETGEERPRLQRTEYWYDAERKQLHTRLLVDGEQITEIVETPEGAYSDLGRWPTGGGFAPQLDPALAGFVTRYREALASGKAQVVGEETVDGRDVKRIRIRLEHGVVEEVTVDAETYKPLSFSIVERPDPAGVIVRVDPRTRRTVVRRTERPATIVLRERNAPEWRVVTIESLPRDPSFFAPPKLSPPRPTASSGGSSEQVSLADAARVLGRPPLWLGPVFEGHELESVELRRFGVDWTDGRETEGTVVTLSYGDVTVSQAVGVAGSYQLGFNDGGEPEPPEGFLAVATPHFADPDMARRYAETRGGQAELRVDGVYVRLEARPGVKLLEVARALRPLS